MPRSTATVTRALAGHTPDPDVRAAVHAACRAGRWRGAEALALTSALATNPHATRDELTAIATGRTGAGTKARSLLRREHVQALLNRSDLTVDDVTAWWSTETRPQILADIIAVPVPGLDAWADERGAAVNHDKVDRTIILSTTLRSTTRLNAALRIAARFRDGEQRPTVVYKELAGLAATSVTIADRLRETAEAAHTTGWARISNEGSWPLQIPETPEPAHFACARPELWRSRVRAWLRSGDYDTDALTDLLTRDATVSLIAARTPDFDGRIHHALRDALAQPSVAGARGPFAARSAAAAWTRAFEPLPDDLFKTAVLATLHATGAEGAGPQELDTQLIPLGRVYRLGTTDADFANAVTSACMRAGVFLPSHISGWTNLHCDTLVTCYEALSAAAADLDDNSTMRYDHPLTRHHASGLVAQLMLSPGTNSHLREQTLQIHELFQRVWNAQPQHHNSGRRVNESFNHAGQGPGTIGRTAPVDVVNSFLDYYWRSTSELVAGAVFHGVDLSALRDPDTLTTFDTLVQTSTASLSDLIGVAEAVKL